MAHLNQVPWDAAILTALSQAPANTFLQDGSQDAAIAAALNAKTVAGVPVTFTWSAVKETIMVLGSWANLVVLSESRPLNEAVKFAINAMSLDGTTQFAPGSFGTKSLLGAVEALVAAGVLTSADQTAITALGTGPTTLWWQSIGAQTPLSAPDIARARMG